MSTDIARALGRDTSPAVGGGYNTRLATGRVLHTHGPEVRQSANAGGTESLTGVPTRDPICVSDPATDYHERVLYGFVTGQTNNSATAIPTIRTILQQTNYLLNEAAVESSGSAVLADFEVACNPSGAIDVGVFSSSSTTFAGISNAAIAAGFDLPKVDYPIFFDAPATTFCGTGDFYFDETLGVDNANNNPTGAGSSYAVTLGGPSAGVANCWPTRTPLHEITHNMGGVQEHAPQSTGLGGHCFQDLDVMCYDDDYDSSTYPMTADCPTVKYDCGYDDYFDAVPEAAEYLESNWNVGGPLNRFILRCEGTCVRISTPQRTVNEVAASIPITVERYGVSSTVFDVTINSVSGTATTPADFTDIPTDTVLSFAGGVLTQTVSVPILADSILEPTESFTVSISGPTNGVALGRASVGVTIRASDQPPNNWVKIAGQSTYAGKTIRWPTVLSSQTRGTPVVARGTTKVFYVVVKNDGNFTNTFRVRGQRSSTQIGVNYKIDGIDRTSTVASTTGRSITLAPGATKVISVYVKPTSSATVNQIRFFTVRSTWTGDAVISDIVKGVIKVVA